MLKIVLKPQDSQMDAALDSPNLNPAPAEFSFHFDSEGDRDSVIAILKDQLGTIQHASSSSLIAAAPALSDQEINARMALLSSHSEWQQLHRELVMKRKTLTEEEFWSSRKEILQQQQQLANQKRGTASALLADIKPTDTDGASNEIKFTVNADIIHSTFTLYPGVHKAYLDLVPDKISEKEFWTKWFGSKYFHRNRTSQAKSQREEDIFESYMTSIENDTNLHPENLLFEAKNKLLDLTRTIEDHLETGNRPDSTMQAGKVKDSLPLIRKFNRHSQLILNGIAQKQTIKKQKVTHDFSKLFQKV
jgi:transcription initiation factor TFIIH subunit 1